MCSLLSISPPPPLPLTRVLLLCARRCAGRTLLASSVLARPVGWSTRGNPSANAGFGNVPDPTYDPAYGGAPEGPSFKTKVVNLISAVRTLMRREWAMAMGSAALNPSAGVI